MRAPNSIVIWSTDFHIAPIDDLKLVAKRLGNVQIIDKSLSGHCYLKSTCAHDLRVLTQRNAYFLGDDPSTLARQVFDAYKFDPDFALVDAIACFLPPAMCRLYAALNKTLIFMAPVRYEAGQETQSQWTNLNAFVRAIPQRRGNVVMANSRYDADYVKHFTGLLHVPYIPSFCGDKPVWNPRRPEILMARSHVPGHDAGFVFEPAIRALGPRFVGISQAYPGRYEYTDLASHPAIVHFPYAPSVMSFFEHYRMGIPIFYPSLDFLVELHMRYGLVSERTWTGTRTQQASSGSVVPPHASRAAEPDPNDDTNEVAVRFWLAKSDGYAFPHILLFDSYDDLDRKSKNQTLLRTTHEAMMRENRMAERLIVAQWKTVFDAIPRLPVTPASYEDGMAQYNL